MERFDLLGPLPAERSTTVLEASAGTGKTFALAGLVTRYVAEGVATLDQMLLITFSRAATQELRDRVRRQIVDAVAAFDDPDLPGTTSRAASAQRNRGRTAGPPPTTARRAGRVRRRHHRHHASVLPTGPAFAGRRWRHRRRGDAGGEPRRADQRDRRRSVPAALRPRARRPAVGLPRRAAAGPRGRQQTGDRAAAERPDARLARRSVRQLRERCSGRTGDPQAASPHPRLRRPAQPTWPTRWTPTTRRLRCGCISGGRSCWSTNFRTPTRCSGR